MRLDIVAVGHKAPDWVNAGFLTYQQRMPKSWPLCLREVVAAKKNPKGSSHLWQETEKLNLQKALKPDAVHIALDAKGQHLSTEALAAYLSRLQLISSHAQFFIGGSDGLSPSLIKEADFVWSLSYLTLPHFLVRVVLAEQLYRAWSILHKHPYHRGD